MRNGLALAVLALTAALGTACAPPPLPDPGRSPVVRQTLRPRPSADQLKAALLDAGELPGGGYQTMTHNEGALGTVSMSDGGDFGRCIGSPSSSAGPTPSTPAGSSTVLNAQAAYQQGFTAASESITLSDPTTATATVNALLDALTTCDRFRVGLVETRWAQLDFPPVGDLSAAFRFSASILQMTFYGDLVVVQYADLVLTVMLVSAAEVEAGAVRELVDLAIAKVRDRLPRL